MPWAVASRYPHASNSDQYSQSRPAAETGRAFPTRIMGNAIVMTDTDDYAGRAAARLQAERLDLRLPEAAVAGVVANLELLASHYAVLSEALAQVAGDA